MMRLPRFLLAACLCLLALLAPASPALADAPVHVVQPGETLYRIALKYGVTVDAIRQANNLSGSVIYAGQSLTIPGLDAPAEVSPSPNANPPGGVHVVQPGETLFLIGLRYNLAWTTIQAANNLPGTRIYVGQRLVIPGQAAGATPEASPAVEATPAPEATPAAETTPAPEATPAPADAPRTHVVQRGETLFTIGLKYNLTWTALQAANNLPDSRIYVGQQLTIPAAGSAAPADQAPPTVEPGQGGAKRFVVDLSEQRLYAYEGDSLVRTTLISSGTWRYPTVTGTFYIYLRYTSARMRGPGYDLANVPYVMYFYQSYGLHGTYWHNNFGTPMSHGCVNMPTSEAEWAYNWSTYGTPVIVQP